MELWRGERDCGEVGDCRRVELVLPVKRDYNGKLPETSATAAAKSRRFARGRCAFHLPDSRKHEAACHTAVVFPAVYAGYIPKSVEAYVYVAIRLGVEERDSTPSPGKLETLLIH